MILKAFQRRCFNCRKCKNKFFNKKNWISIQSRTKERENTQVTEMPTITTVIYSILSSDHLGFQDHSDNDEEVKDNFKFRNQEKDMTQCNSFKKLFGVKRELKQNLKTRNMRIIDEETLKMLDVEFVLKQEMHHSDCIKERILPNQLIRTTEQVKVM
jgi:hypothetical protein